MLFALRPRYLFYSLMSEAQRWKMYFASSFAIYHTLISLPLSFFQALARKKEEARRAEEERASTLTKEQQRKRELKEYKQQMKKRGPRS